MHARWLLDTTERWLETIPDGAPVSTHQVCAHATARHATDDEAYVVIAALTDIGVLVPGRPPRLSREALSESAGYRRGGPVGLHAVPKEETGPLPRANP